MNLTTQLLLLKRNKVKAARELAKAREWVIKHGETSKNILYIDQAHATVLERYRAVFDEYTAINEALDTALALGYKEMIDAILDEYFPSIALFEAPPDTSTLKEQMKNRFKE